MAQYTASTYGKVYGTASGSGGYVTLAQTYDFTSAERTWVITHNFSTNKFIIEMIDDNDQIFYARAVATSVNEITIYLTQAMTGHANVIFII